MSATVFFASASELATLTNTFKNSAGTATDPTTISLTVTDPDRAATTYTFAASQITKTSTGVYTKDIACATAGTWEYVWTGTGAVADVIAGTWEVHPAEVGKLYATVEALKSRFADTATTDDLEYHGACFAASRWVEEYCQRVFYRSATGTARTFVPCGYYDLYLPVFNDLVSVASLKTDASGDGTFETTWASSDYQLLPYNPAAAPTNRPYTRVKAIGSYTFPTTYGRLARDDRVEITGVWGWPAVPPGIKQAALIIASELFKSKDTFQSMMGFEDVGQVSIRRNPMALDLLKPYRRHAVLVA